MNKLFQRHSIGFYFLMWAIIIVAHTFVLYGVYDIPCRYAFTDAFVFNLIYALIGGGVWYMVRFSNLQSKPKIQLVLNHLAGSVVTIIIWLTVSYFLINSILEADREYDDFLQDSMIFRVISGLFYYSILVSIYYLIINIKELKRKMAHEAKLNEMLKDAELKMLRSQIRPHFLFNSLNSISSLTMTNPGRAQEMVIKLSEFMRYSLNYSDEKLIPLENEVYHIQLYLDIEKVRFGKKLSVNFDIPEKCKALDLPALLLQPLVENAIKYGLYEATGEVNINIDVSCQSNYLLVRVGNDYDPDATPKKGTGTGLKNVEKRLQTVYSSYELMKINRKENYFEVELKIPQHDKN